MSDFLVYLPRQSFQESRADVGKLKRRIVSLPQNTWRFATSQLILNTPRQKEESFLMGACWRLFKKVNKQRRRRSMQMKNITINYVEDQLSPTERFIEDRLA